MKKILVTVLGVAGFVISWGAVSTAEVSPDFTMLQLVGYTYMGLMMIGAAFALARWE